MARNILNRVLVFNSIYILQIIEIIYLKLIEKLKRKQSVNKSTLIIVRNDRRGKFTTSASNISGIKCGKTADEIDVLSFKFYQFLRKYDFQNQMLYGDIPLYDLYTRQVKLKLTDTIIATLQLYEWSLSQENDIEIISDAQTIEIIRETLSFLELQIKNIKWKKQYLLTLVITINSILMRLASIIINFFSKSTLPKTYYKRRYKDNYPTILITLSAKDPKRFFNSYIKKIKHFNIILYSIGILEDPLEDYEVINIKIKKKYFSRFLVIFQFLGIKSFIADILLIHKNHMDLKISTSIVENILDNENIDVLLNNEQVKVIDNYFVIHSRKSNISIISDVFEEIYTCDGAILGCEANLTRLTKLAISSSSYVIRGVNEFMKYRLFNLKDPETNYIKKLLKLKGSQNVIFYASDPVKLERQRYDSEFFLINHLSKIDNTCLVVKIHPQDTGKITLLAYNNANRPDNVKLIADLAQKENIISPDFNIFPSFNFGAAMSSCDGFITSHSSSAMEALALKIKIGILDIVDHCNFRPMIKYQGAVLINGKSSLDYFLKIKNWRTSHEALKYYGLDSKKNEHFDLGKNILNLSVLNRNIKKI